MNDERRHDRWMLACAGIGLVFHVVVHSILLRAFVPSAPSILELGSDGWEREVWPVLVRLFWLQTSLDLAVVAALGVFAWRGRIPPLGVLAAFLAIACAIPGIDTLYYVAWNVPFWLAVVGTILGFARRPRGRRVAFQLAGIAAFSLLVGHFVVTSID